MSDVSKEFEPILKALPRARAALKKVKNVVNVRPGYAYPDDRHPVPAIIVAVVPGQTPVKPLDLAHEFEVPVAVVDASVEEQLSAREVPEGASFAPGFQVQRLRHL